MPLDKDLVARAISYHGLPLQKMWEGERGDAELVRLGLVHPDYSLYQSRQKYLTFQDRAKRLRLHQFISKYADPLYDLSLTQSFQKRIEFNGMDTGEIVQMAPYEVFLNVDAGSRQRHFFETVQPGDIIYGSVITLNQHAMLIKPICCSGSIQRFIGDIGIKAYLDRYNMPPSSTVYTVNCYVCCEVLEVDRAGHKLVLGMKGTHERTDDGPPLGLITTENFPDVYKTAAQIKGRTYQEVLEESPAFNNPHSEEVLYRELGLSSKEYYSNMSLRGKFADNEYATELRHTQASKWAFRSVAEGIEHFKEGRHSEAFQCLNKALNMDPRNVEGLVARGALYANSGSFKKACEDFETALKLNNSHANARKYLGETLVALGRSYEEENKMEDARKAYQDCLKIMPNHEEAYSSLQYLQSRFSAKQIVEPNELELPALNLKKQFDIDKDKKDDSKKDKKTKKEKKKKNKKKHDSSSDSTSSSDSSDSSSSDSSSSDSSASSDDERSSKKKRKNEASPFTNAGYGGQFDYTKQFHASSSSADDYESKVRKFIEMTRDDDDYEEKVRKFVAEAAKYQRERITSEKDSKKKKRKDEKKAKKESKKKRKKEKHSKKKDKLDLNDLENKKLREALKIFENLPVLDDLGAKLSEIYGAKAGDASKTGNSATSKQSQQHGPGRFPKSIEQQHASEPGKWKMMFPKEDNFSAGASGKISTTRQQTQSDKVAVNLKASNPHQQTSTVFNRLDNPLKPNQVQQQQQQLQESSKRKLPTPVGIFGRALQQTQNQAAPPVKQGPVVLDKFGNFRLAQAEPLDPKPPEPMDHPHSRSRSRSRGRHHRSRSNSRSRSRSRRRSFGRRSRSRSPGRHPGGRFGNRFGSRSRSRSFSPARRFNRFGGGPHFNRFGGPFNARSRSPMGYRGRGRGFRGTRYGGRFGGRYGGGISRSRSISPFRYGGGSNRGSRRSRDSSRPRDEDRRGRRDDYADRQRSRQDDSRSGSSKDDAKNTRDSKDRRGKDVKKDSNRDAKANNDSKDKRDKKPISKTPTGNDDVDIAATEKMLEQARKDRKEEMKSRNPDLIKQPSDAF